MRFSLIFLILFYSQILAQSTFFFKFSSDANLIQKEDQIKSLVSQELNTIRISSEESIRISHLFPKLAFDDNPLRNILKVEFPNNLIAEQILNSLSKDNDLDYTKELSIYRIDQIPSDSLFEEQWALININAPEAWDLIPSETDDILLAVIDTGIDFFHPDIKNNIFTNTGETGIDDAGNNKIDNGIDDDGNGFIDDFQGWDFVDKQNIFPAELKDDFTDWDNSPMDENGHGTNIAGIIAAEHNNKGIAGAGKNIKVLNLRAFDKNGNGEEDDVATAILYAVNMGARVINMSFGDTKYSQLLRDVISYAYSKGVVLVGSAGNDGNNLPHFPSGFSEVISVGAIQKGGGLASFSNFGSTLDLVAPGSQIITLGLAGGYKTVSGTSASAPFVSTAAAVLLSQKDFKNEEVKQILKSTANDLGTSGWDDQYAAGNLDMLKMLKILSPATLKFNFPAQGYATKSDSLSINISCLSPYFKEYEVYYGIGLNPNEWILIKKGTSQFFNESIKTMDISTFADTSYTLRLLMERIDQNTQEERINFYIDRTSPQILAYNLFPALLNDVETIQVAIQTDDLTSAKMFYRRINSNDEFRTITLDGFNRDITDLSTQHFGFIPPENLIDGIGHEFYFEITNQVGDISKLLDGTKYFIGSNNIQKKEIESSTKNYSLPTGRIFEEPFKLGGLENNYVFINKNNNAENASLYKFSNDNFTEVAEIIKKIPISVNDINNDGKKEIISLFVKNGYIDSQSEIGGTKFINSFSDSSDSFWPAYSDDIDGDGKYEIVTFSSDTTISIWEVSSNLDLSLEAILSNFASSNENQKSIFRNNSVLVDNFDNDQQQEILVLDNLGQLLIYQIDGVNNYSNERIIEHFNPIESNSNLAKGDYDGDGNMDIGILMEFEENVFLTPLIYLSVINISDSQINYLFQNMFISTENNFISSFDKQYRSITFSNIDQDQDDELIVANFPNAYIFDFATENNLLFYKTNVNMQQIFVGDLDDNGITEIGLADREQIIFYEFTSDGLIAPPVITDYYSIDEEHTYFEWFDNDNPVYIYRGVEENNLVLYDSTTSLNYKDSVESDRHYSYAIVYYDQNNFTQLSKKSKRVNIFAHASGKLKKFELLNNNSINISFSEEIDNNQSLIDGFLIDDSLSAITVTNSRANQLFISLPKLDEGFHTIKTNKIRDIFHTPIIDTLVSFKIANNDSTSEFLFISNYNIRTNKQLEVIFNFNLDTISASNKRNYLLSPNNIVEDVQIISKNSVLVTTKNPFGSIGKEYVLKISNVYSSHETGSLSISSNSGSEIVLSSNSKNLNDIYVFPNPVNLSEHQTITFANLTERVDIYIFSIDGLFIEKISETDGNGGVDWDLTDQSGNFLPSGIYFFKAIALNNFDKTLQEKIGKFAVIR